MNYTKKEQKEASVKITKPDSSRQLLKKSIRREMLAKRSALSSEYVAAAEKSSMAEIMSFLRRAAEKLSQSDGGSRRPHQTAAKAHAALRVMSYMSYRNEFPTWLLNQEIIKAGYTLILPYTDTYFNITACVTRSLDELAPSPMGILEPALESCPHVAPDDIDVILMPGVAFDMHGSRIGFGKGCYDRFLAGAQGSRTESSGCMPVLAALAYSFQILPEIPSEPSDIPCSIIITEKEILQI